MSEGIAEKSKKTLQSLGRKRSSIKKSALKKREADHDANARSPAG